MSPRPFPPIGLACLAVLLFMGSTACSSSQPRDQYYGTDAGAGYHPEAAVFTEGSGDAGDFDDASDATASLDRMQSNDSPAEPEATDAPEATDTAESDADIG